MYTLGKNSLYDLDIELIKRFIRHNDNPKDRNIAISVFEYYTSSLRSYWDLCRDNIDNAGLHYNHSKDFHKIKDNFIEIENEFFKILDETIASFNKKNKINIVHILTLIYYINYINCLKFPKKFEVEMNINSDINIIDKYPSDSNFYFLFNNTGHFALNTYLYAFFNKVHIMGIPSHYISHFDEEVDCPMFFIQHDLTHYSDFSSALIHRNKYKDIFYVIREKYFNILNNENLDQKEKEAIIFLIWFYIHEHPEYLNHLLLNNEDFVTKIKNFRFFVDLEYVFKDFTKTIHDNLYNENIDPIFNLTNRRIYENEYPEYEEFFTYFYFTMTYGHYLLVNN